MKDVDDCLRFIDPHMRNPFIYGLRRSGKTTSLKYIETTLKEYYPEVVTIFINSIDSLTIEVLKRAANVLGDDAIKKLSLSATLLGFLNVKVNSKYQGLDKYTFQSDMEQILLEYKRRGLQLVVLIDEVQHITPDTREYFGAYKTFSTNSLPIMTIAAGLTPDLNSAIK
ncbi:MAG: ATP-binding protein [Lactobacillaceae bacterium]|jgi:predicted AAA+ superfamily ATPase|nr:ATP-binding protein [Lactobacillaceae bacterium]